MNAGIILQTWFLPAVGTEPHGAFQQPAQHPMVPSSSRQSTPWCLLAAGTAPHGAFKQPAQHHMVPSSSQHSTTLQSDRKHLRKEAGFSAKRRTFCLELRLKKNVRLLQSLELKCWNVEISLDAGQGRGGALAMK